jgi:hypothetical protein
MKSIHPTTWLKRWRTYLHDFFFGMTTSWVMAPVMLKRRTELERVFMLMTTSDLMGIPLSPPPSGLRLLPFLVPQILYWRRRLALWDDELEGLDLKFMGH